jgi:hypothetical protein
MYLDSGRTVAMSNIDRLQFFSASARPAIDRRFAQSGLRARRLPPLVEQLLLFCVLAGAAAGWLGLIWSIVG